MSNSQSKNRPTLIGVMAAVMLVGVAAAAIGADVGLDSLSALRPVALAIGVVIVTVVIIAITRMVTAQGVLPQLDEAFSLLNFQRTTDGEGLWQYNGEINAQPVSVMLHPGPALEIEVSQTLRGNATIRPARGTTPGTASGDLSYLAITSADPAWTQTILGDEEIRESLKTLLPNDPNASLREIGVRSRLLTFRVDGIKRGAVNPDEVRQWVYDAADLAKSLAEHAPEVDPAVSAEKYPTLDEIKAVQAGSGNSPQVKATAAVTIAISIALVVLGLVMSIVLASN